MADTSNSVSSGSSAQGSGSSSKAAASLASLSSDFGNFLTLLTTQLKNQDPLSPLETHEFTNQLVMFAGVEQQIRSNAHLESISTAMQLNTLSQAQQLVGKQIDYTQGKLTFDSTGKMEIEIIAKARATQATLQIFDEKNNLAHQLPISNGLSVGGNRVTWDGSVRRPDGTILKRLNSGEYTVRVTNAVGEDGRPLRSDQIDVNNERSGAIRSVAYENQKLYAVVNNTERTRVPFENIVSISEVSQDERDELALSIASAANLVGRNLRYRLSTAPLTSEGLKAQFSVPGDVFSASVYITNAQNQVIHVGTVQLPGKSPRAQKVQGDYTWNGTAYKLDDKGKIQYVLDSSGKSTGKIQTTKVSEGEFRYYIGKMQAYNEDGKTLRTVSDNEGAPIFPERKGVVTGLDVVDGQVILRTAKARVPITAVSGLDPSSDESKPAASPSILKPGETTSQAADVINEIIQRILSPGGGPVADAVSKAGVAALPSDERGGDHADIPNIGAIAAALAPPPLTQTSRPWGEAARKPLGVAGLLNPQKGSQGGGIARLANVRPSPAASAIVSAATRMDAQALASGDWRAVGGLGDERSELLRR